MRQMKITRKNSFMVGDLSFDTEEEALAYIENYKNKISFKTEKEMIKFLIENSENFASLYKNTVRADFTLLPAYVDELSKLIGKESDKYNLHYNYHHTYNSLFKDFNVNSAILKFRNIVSDVELSDEKIKRIYKELEADWCPGADTALEEVEEFIKFARLLSS